MDNSCPWNKVDDYESYGSEYIDPNGKPSPLKLVLEIHNLNRILDREFRAEFINFSNFLFENFVCVYSNGNNNTGVTAFNNFVLANTIELTLVSKKIVQKLEGSVRNYSVQNNLKAPILKPFYEYNK